MRRTKEFDKPDLLGDVSWGVNPEFHTVKPSNDEWRSQRKLLQDLMSPGFLHGTAAPQLHDSFMDMIRLWKEKIRLTQGHPFSVREDISNTALEAIWASLFGIEETATSTRNQVELLSTLKRVDLPATADDAVDLPRAPIPASFEAVIKLTESIEVTLKSPFPRFTGFCQRYLPSQRKYQKIKDRVLNEQISLAEARLTTTSEKTETGSISNGVDLMLRREQMAAEKQNRLPNYHSEVMRAEVTLPLSPHLSISTYPELTPTSALRSPRRRPRHNLQHPPLVRKTPLIPPTYANPSPHRPAHRVPPRPHAPPRPLRPRNRHFPRALPRRLHRRANPHIHHHRPPLPHRDDRRRGARPRDSPGNNGHVLRERRRYAGPRLRRAR